jgi:hypothetical protein
MQILKPQALCLPGLDPSLETTLLLGPFEHLLTLLLQSVATGAQPRLLHLQIGPPQQQGHGHGNRMIVAEGEGQGQPQQVGRCGQKVDLALKNSI